MEVGSGLVSVLEEGILGRAVGLGFPFLAVGGGANRKRLLFYLPDPDMVLTH